MMRRYMRDALLSSIYILIKSIRYVFLRSLRRFAFVLSGKKRSSGNFALGPRIRDYTNFRDPLSSRLNLMRIRPVGQRRCRKFVSFFDALTIALRCLTRENRIADPRGANISLDHRRSALNFREMRVGSYKIDAIQMTERRRYMIVLAKQSSRADTIVVVRSNRSNRVEHILS